MPISESTWYVFRTLATKINHENLRKIYVIVRMKYLWYFGFAMEITFICSRLEAIWLDQKWNESFIEF